MTQPVVRDPIYRCRRYPSDVIETCVRWYISYRRLGGPNGRAGHQGVAHDNDEVGPSIRP